MKGRLWKRETGDRGQESGVNKQLPSLPPVIWTRRYNPNAGLVEIPHTAILKIYPYFRAKRPQVDHEGAFQRPADLREVQADQAQGRCARDLRGPPAQATARLGNRYAPYPR